MGHGFDQSKWTLKLHCVCLYVAKGGMLITKYNLYSYDLDFH